MVSPISCLACKCGKLDTTRSVADVLAREEMGGLRNWSSSWPSLHPFQEVCLQFRQCSKKPRCPKCLVRAGKHTAAWPLRNNFHAHKPWHRQFLKLHAEYNTEIRPANRKACVNQMSCHTTEFFSVGSWQGLLYYLNIYKLCFVCYSGLIVAEDFRGYFGWHPQCRYKIQLCHGLTPDSN